jgi:hypothetical protein
LPRMERRKRQTQTNLLQSLLRLSTLQPDPSTPQDLTHKRRSVRERSRIERLLFRKEAELVEDSGDEVREGFGAEVVWDDLGFDGTETGESEGDVEDAETGGTDVTEGLYRSTILLSASVSAQKKEVGEKEEKREHTRYVSNASSATNVAGCNIITLSVFSTIFANTLSTSAVPLFTKQSASWKPLFNRASATATLLLTSASTASCFSSAIRSGLLSVAAAGFFRARDSRSSASQRAIWCSFEFAVPAAAAFGLAVLRTVSSRRAT